MWVQVHHAIYVHHWLFTLPGSLHLSPTASCRGNFVLRVLSWLSSILWTLVAVPRGRGVAKGAIASPKEVLSLPLCRQVIVR